MASGQTNPRYIARLKRKKRIRRKVEGIEVRPRLTVFRSDKHIYAQIINDVTGTTLVSASTLSPDTRKWGRSRERWTPQNALGTRCQQGYGEGYCESRFRSKRLYLSRAYSGPC